MATASRATPNRRGARSREDVLDAAERLMAAHGYEAATVSAIVSESGIPPSSVYHYFGSKDGVLLAVMERGAERFFAELPEPEDRIGSPTEHLSAITDLLAVLLSRHPDFLRLLIAFAAQPSDSSRGEVQEVVRRVRRTALERLAKQLAIAFDDDHDDPVIGQLARFGLATIDGAFIAQQADPGVDLRSILAPLTAGTTAMRESLRAANNR